MVAGSSLALEWSRRLSSTAVMRHSSSLPPKSTSVMPSRLSGKARKMRSLPRSLGISSGAGGASSCGMAKGVPSLSTPLARAMPTRPSASMASSSTSSLTPQACGDRQRARLSTRRAV